MACGGGYCGCCGAGIDEDGKMKTRVMSLIDGNGNEFCAGDFSPGEIVKFDPMTGIVEGRTASGVRVDTPITVPRKETISEAVRRWIRL